MRKVCLVVAALALLGLSAVQVQADIVERTYAFTGADMINNVFGSNRYSTDGSLWVYEGQRSLFPGLEFTYTGAGATYLGTSGSWATNFNNLFSAAVADNRVLSTFQLSGMDGYARQWGEKYKPLEWVSGTGPTGWAFSLITDDDPPTGALTNQRPVWTTSTDGLALTSTELANQQFSVTVKFDTTDMWWPDAYVYGSTTAPNSMDDGLTMYFSSYFSKDGTDINLYEGNMMATAVPEPTAMTILASGLLGMVLKRRRKA